MKARIALATLMIALPAGMASAQGPLQGTVSIDGTVAGRCVLGSPSQAAVPLGVLIDTAGPRAGRLRPIAATTINFPGSWCNFANTRISVSANAILAADATAPSAGFARAVNFTSTVTNWAASNAAVTTAASAAGGTAAATGNGGTNPAPKLADLTMTLNNFAVPSDLLLVTGNYAGAVTITLGSAS